MSVISTKILIVDALQLLVLGVVFFLAAGTLSWSYGWIFLILFYSFGIVLFMWVLRHNPGLVEERTGFKPDEPIWDKAIVVLSYIVIGIWWIFMPFDAVRFHWSHMPTWLHLVGAIVFSCSWYLFYSTFRENPYLSSVVHIQEERGQTVVSTGPYQYVRHPLYTSALLFFLGSTLLLGSWIGILLGLLLEGIFARRAVLEEQWLQKGLEGYDSYMARVRWRLIPYVW